jgi:SSS family solute:Na+ symporter
MAAMISGYDYGIIGLYLAFLISIGFVFRRWGKDSADYFAGGFRMNWWLVGAGSFVSNFSCWTFTGAAHMAYTYGVLILAIYLMEAVAFGVGYLWFASRLRQLRLVTPMDAVRLRFGRGSEQFYTWLGFLNSLGIAAVWLVSLAVILGAAFQFPGVPVIAVTGGLVIVLALVGGSWAVAAADFVQLVVLLGVTTVVTVLVLWRLGGVGPFLAQIPRDHWRIFHVAGSIPYDWLYLTTCCTNAILMRNNLQNAGKYVAAKDSAHARKSALVPLVGYVVMPVIWMIPPLAAATLVPDLTTRTLMSSPGEASYIAVCLAVLPKGMIGLIIVCMFASTVACMDVALNKNAGNFVKNFYLPLIRPKAAERELVAVGRFATVLFGAIVTGGALLLTTRAQVNLFDAFIYLGAYLGVPLAVPLLMGMLIRGAPIWAGWATTVLGILITLVIYNLAPLEFGRGVLIPWLGPNLYGYLVTNKFVVSNLVGVPVTALFFWGTRLFGPPTREPATAFFARMDRPVDFEREVGRDNTPTQAKLVGRLTSGFGLFILSTVLIPNPAWGRVCLLGCAVIPLGIGFALLRYAGRGEATSPNSPPPFS